MGLSGRRIKQRIGKDPRNLSWADDASRFGQTYLAKFGWDSSKGLGASGEGRTSAIKASQKLDMLGIGMRQQQNNPDGIAWRQNRDFENLLRRLNEGTPDDDATGPFHEARQSSESLGGGGGGGREEEAASLRETENLERAKDDDEDGKDVMTARKEKKKKKKKRKSTDEVEKEEEEEEEEAGLDKKERKKRKTSKDGDEHHAMPSGNDESSEPSPAPAEAPAHAGLIAAGGAAATASAVPIAAPVPVPVRAPPRSHRARIMAAKRMASSDPTALAEILGIPSSSSSSSSLYPSAVSTPTPISDPALATTTTTTTISTATVASAVEAQDPLQKLTTSSQSVGDYFRAKLSAKANGERRRPCPTLAAAGGATAAATSATAIPREGDDDDREGLGLGGGASRAPLITDDWDGAHVRRGIGALSSRFAAMFTQEQPTTDDAGEEKVSAGVELVVVHDAAASHGDDRKKSQKRRAKDERRREKEERRRKRAEATSQVEDAVVEVPDGEAIAEGAKKKKRRRSGSCDSGSKDTTHPSDAGGMETIPTKKQKSHKDQKSPKHRRRREE